jgi:hypothetical protein
VTRPIRASSRRGLAKPSGKSRKVIAPAAGGLFFPQSKSLGLDQGEASPALLEKITYAGIVASSFGQASQVLHKLADLPIPEKQVERVTERSGAERVAERAAEVAAFQALPLAEKFGVPAGVTPPALAVVMVDGGRLQILDRSQQKEPAATPAANAGGTAGNAPHTAADVSPPPTETPAPNATATQAAVRPEEAWEEETAADGKAGHWREDKIGLLLGMDSVVSDRDPCPEIPECFVDPTRILKLVRELKKSAKATADAVADSDTPEAADDALAADAVYDPPKVGQRKVVASGARWPAFAVLVAAAAWRLGLQGGSRRGFVGDGSANNWALQRRFFGSFVAILDFIHALSYVFAAAQAGRTFVAGWACYKQWIAWVWQGQVTRVIAALEQRQAELGVPEKDESETSPRQVVAKTLTYLVNQQDKMRYDEYRKQGLPLTSSLMESVVKQVNQRVKGTEKFWSEEGSEAVLQLRADHLSDDQPLKDYWQRRQAKATGQRRYRRVG